MPMGKTTSTRASSRRRGGEAKEVWAKEVLLQHAYERLRQRKRDLATRHQNPSGGTGEVGSSSSSSSSSSSPRLPATATAGSGTTTAPLDAAKLALAGSGPKLAVAGETKDTGFKRPAKLQRKLDEIKDNPAPVMDDKPSKKRRTSIDESRSPEEPPPQGYGGYFRGYLEEPVDGDYYPTTIFVGGLGEDTQERDLERAFSRFGPIDAIRLIPHKNFGFVKFRTPDACQASIMGMDGQVLGSNRIRVDRAKVPSSRNPWKRRSWDGQGDYSYQHRGPEGPDYGYGGPRDAAYTPYDIPSLRGEPPVSYSAPPPHSSSPLPRAPVSPNDRESQEAPEGTMADEPDDPGRQRVQYDDL